jgi:hypothetical protein
MLVGMTDETKRGTTLSPVGSEDGRRSEEVAPEATRLSPSSETSPPTTLRPFGEHGTVAERRQAPKKGPVEYVYGPTPTVDRQLLFNLGDVSEKKSGLSAETIGLFVERSRVVEFLKAPEPLESLLRRRDT